MPLIAMQCKNCGDTLQVDPSQGTYRCPSCGSVHKIEKSISQTFQTTNIGHIENATIIDDGSGKINQEIRNGEAHLHLKKYQKARAIFEDLTDRHADKYQSWFGLARSITEDFTKDPYGASEYSVVADALHSAVELSPFDAREEIVAIETEYCTKWQNHFNRLITERNNKLEAIDAQANKVIPPKELEINNLRATITRKTVKVERWQKARELIPFIMFVIVGVLTLPSSIDASGLILGILSSALLSALAVLLPLKILLFLICNAIRIPAEATINRSNERIRQLMDAIQTHEAQFEEERVAAVRATRWLDI